MNTTKPSRVDRIIALIDACLADIDASPGSAKATSASTNSRCPGPTSRP
jgi:hypothetical protein